LALSGTAPFGSGLVGQGRPERAELAGGQGFRDEPTGSVDHPPVVQRRRWPAAVLTDPTVHILDENEQGAMAACSLRSLTNLETEPSPFAAG
jgi:hypothetical protein